jgi:hypothetical protein
MHVKTPPESPVRTNGETKPERLYTSREARELLGGISEPTFRRLIKEGDLHFVLHERISLVPQSAIDEYLARPLPDPEPTPPTVHMPIPPNSPPRPLAQLVPGLGTERLYNSREARELLGGISESKFRQITKSGELFAKKQGAYVYVPQSAIDAYIAALPPAAEPAA